MQQIGVEFIFDQKHGRRESFYGLATSASLRAAICTPSTLPSVEPHPDHEEDCLGGYLPKS